jgi:hypothetical protein
MVAWPLLPFLYSKSWDALDCEIQMTFYTLHSMAKNFVKEELSIALKLM